MNSKIKHILLISIISLLVNLTFGQSLSFEHIGSDDGFPESTILCLKQDQSGFIWIGTTDGLFRYDGSEFKEFRYDNRDSSSISSNYIKCFHEDRKGNLWIGTAMGLNKYNPKKERFERYIQNGSANTFEAQNNIHSIAEDRNGYIWYGTYGGLFRLSTKPYELLHFLPEVENPNSIAHKNVWKVFEDQSGLLWFGTGKGISVYKNDSTFQFQTYLPETGNANGLKTDQVWDFAQQPDGTIWLGSNQGIYRVIENQGQYHFTEIKHQPDNNNSLSHDFIEKIEVDGEDTLWVGTYDGGLNKVIIRDDGLLFERFEKDASDEKSISSNKVSAFLRDWNNNLWIGTGAGLDKVSHLKNKFNSIISDNNNFNSLSDLIIKSILRDRNGNLWVGTRYGLNFLSNEKFEKEDYDFEKFYYKQGELNCISNSNIFELLEDSLGLIWICTYNGLNYVKLDDFEKSIRDNQKPIFNYFKTQHGLPHNYIRGISEIKKGVYWIMTYGQLSKMTFDSSNKTAKFQNFDMDNSKPDALVNASTMVAGKDKYGNYWIGTFNGLSKYRINQSREFFENYKNEPGNPHSLSNNVINDILLDSKDRLWVATRGGLNLVIQNSEHGNVSFRNYGFYDGLPNDVIQSIEEDRHAHLWIGTNRGLIQFDPESPYNPVINTYLKEDGLASNALVFRSSYIDDTGRLYFGTPDGLHFFYPQNIEKNNNPPKIILTELKVLNKVVFPSDDENSILKKSISFTDHINLNYWQNSISVKFAVLDFTNPAKNKFAYRLNDIHKEWINTENLNEASFTNLSPGNYLLEVKGSNNDGVWSTAPLELKINITPPPWRSWWAYAIYVLVVLSTIMLFIKYRTDEKIKKVETARAIDQARFKEREQLRKQNAADFHDELGHRLTKLSLFIELANRQISDNVALQKYLDKISEHAKGLSLGMRDLIWSLDPQSDSLFQTVLRLQEFGDKLFEGTSTKFISSGISESFNELALSPDIKKQILMIFKEAMHNCLKYAKADECNFSISIECDSVIFSLLDNGVGFDINEQPKGYGLRNMQVRAKKINSQIEISSIKGISTSVELHIVLAQMG